MDNMSTKWTVIALDMRALLGQDKGAHFKCTRSVQFCGNIRTRGTYASDIKYAKHLFVRKVAIAGYSLTIIVHSKTI